MSDAINLLGVLDQAIERERQAGQATVAQVAARGAAVDLIAFIENLATPLSEPLNSAVGYRNKESRRHFMGVIRARAQDLLDRVDGAA